MFRLKNTSKNLIESRRIQYLMTEFIKSESSDYPDYKANFINNLLDSLKDFSLKEVSDLVFKEAIKLTESDYCYVAYLDPENNDSVGISFSHLTDDCKMYAEIGEARFKVLNDGTYGGLLGYSLDTGESFYVHDINSHPAAHGLPQGHEPVDQFLSVPVKYEEKILGQIVVANPKKDYTDDHLHKTDKLAGFYGIILKKMLY